MGRKEALQILDLTSTKNLSRSEINRTVKMHINRVKPSRKEGLNGSPYLVKMVKRAFTNIRSDVN